MAEYDELKLSNQICFPLYAASRLVTREYQPHLDALGITYPQYLVLLVLWEFGEMPVNEIAERLILNTNTLTPLLKRMEAQGLVSRERSGKDERKVIIRLTEDGKVMRIEALKIPRKLVEGLVSERMSIEDLKTLKANLDQLLTFLVEKQDLE